MIKAIHLLSYVNQQPADLSLESAPMTPPMEISKDSLSQSMLADRHWLRQTLRAIDQTERGGGDAGPLRERLRQRWVESNERWRQRQSLELKITYPEELPISSRHQEIVAAIRAHQVVIICGETGSGKSTQLPKMCWDAGLGRAAMIGHTQPRRIAARSIAARVAEEMQTSVGQLVGYKVRFSDQTAAQTVIKLMTDGMLLAETTQDRFLEKYDCIIIDEAHERSLNIDFLMGYLRRLLDRRKDLHVIITSATIDAERFAEHFGTPENPAPVLEVSGRGYPVEVRYRPWEAYQKPKSDQAASSEPREYDLARHVLAAFDEAVTEGDGDLLIFLPTERDIREITTRLAGHCKRLGWQSRFDVLPLYARLSAVDQQRVFQGSNRRRIVLSTNVAESSLTVPGIRYVIDAGTARISRYSPRSKVQRLPIEPISRASADQRAGRCGRVGPGICFRLFSPEDYLSRDAFTTPEMRRTNLAAVILQSLVLKLGPLEDFPLLDPPREDQIREGFKTLRELQAVDDHRQLTEIGHQLGKLPIDPRIGRMIIEAKQRNCLNEVLVIAAALEAQDPRDRPPEKKDAADQAHRPFQDPGSDFVSFLKLWEFYSLLRKKLSKSQLKKACQQNFLSQVRLREWADLVHQLHQVATSDQRTKAPRKKKSLEAGASKVKSERVEVELGNEGVLDETRYASVHQALLSGLLSGVALAGEKHTYQGAGGQQLFLWPGSGVFASKPKWIVAAELVETSRRYARTVARIDPNWLEPLAGHLLKRTYSEPHWSRKSQAAMCYERVMLFGLPVVLRRRVHLATVDPTTAREMLIEHGLVASELESRAKFYQHNEKLRQHLAALADKTRRRDLVIDGYAMQRFYEERLPADCVGRIELEKLDRTLKPPAWVAKLATESDVAVWLNSQDAVTSGGTQGAVQDAEVSTLYMKPEDVIAETKARLAPQAFPDRLEVAGCELPLEYRYAPGSETDGVRVTIPAAALGQISEARLGWFVPGLLEEKLTALIKSLPKRIRRNFVPAADIARRLASKLSAEYGQTPFMEAVCRELAAIGEVAITVQDFDQEKLPEHVRFLVHVVDDSGEIVAVGRDVDVLRQQLSVPTLAAGQPVEEMPDPEGLLREGLTTFEPDEIPSQVVRVRGGVRVTLYPGMVDSGETVAIRLFDSQLAAQHSSLRGLTRLYALAERKELRSQVQWLPSREKAAVQLAGAFPDGKLNEHLHDLLARLAFVNAQPLVQTKEDFEIRRIDRGRRIMTATQEISEWLPKVGEAYHAVRLRIELMRGGKHEGALVDVREQVKHLLHVDELRDAPWEWLKHLPRYLKAIDYRLDKLRSGGEARDRSAMSVLEPLNRVLVEQRLSGVLLGDSLQEYRWTIEELRVSLFAQPLGTSVKVSPQRVEKMREQLLAKK